MKKHIICLGDSNTHGYCADPADCTDPELARFNEVLENAFQETAPHKICQYIYGLSDAFNSFYHDTRILSQEDSLQQAGWIRLITLVKEVLTACIQVLGFEAPERM